MSSGVVTSLLTAAPLTLIGRPAPSYPIRRFQVNLEFGRESPARWAEWLDSLKRIAADRCAARSPAVRRPQPAAHRQPIRCGATRPLAARRSMPARDVTVAPSHHALHLTPWRHSRNVVAANNYYDAEYIAHFTGLRVEVIPSYCGYAASKAHYRPTFSRPLLLARNHNNPSHLYTQLHRVTVARTLT